MLLPGNVRDRLPRVGIDDHRVSASGNVESVIFSIHGDVVHAALTTNMKSFFDGPCALRGNASAKRERDHCDQKASEYIPTVHEILQ